MSQKNFNETMEATRIMIWNASNDPIIQPRLQIYSYTPEKLEEGKAIWNATDAINKQQAIEQSEQSEATAQFNAAYSLAKKMVKRLKKICRLAFPDNNSVWNHLNLKTLNISRFEDWQNDSEKLYENLLGNPQWVSTLGSYGYTPEALSVSQQEVGALKTLQENQHREIGDAQQATKDKAEKYSQLKDWCRHLKGVAQIEFENDPQLLEKLGIRVRS